MPKMNILSVPLSVGLLLLTGCSDGEATKDAEKTVKIAEEKTGEAANKAGELAGKAEDKANEAAQMIKEKTPVLVENMKNTYQDGEQKLKENTLQKGDKATITKDAYLAYTPEAYEELYQLIEINDLKGIQNIEQNDQVTEISKSNEVEVLEREIRRTKVKVIDTGKEGYLPTNMLSPIK
ncbi:hypothetical protein [Mesobacillus foraminis]|uniref:hypothetical protein n=1 Tax=Mesobacillus foraminis TaxID=279826 RepID=UPI000EF520BA|nr:hypothetical protein [Mesobacillus foraminis]